MQGRDLLLADIALMVVAVMAIVAVNDGDYRLPFVMSMVPAAGGAMVIRMGYGEGRDFETFAEMSLWAHVLPALSAVSLCMAFVYLALKLDPSTEYPLFVIMLVAVGAAVSLYNRRRRGG